jgi:O-glycosyl hydrolase
MLGKYKYLFAALLAMSALSLRGQTSTITWTNVHQTMDGFGGQDWNANGGTHGTGFSFTQPQSDLLFSGSTGIGLQFIRTQNYFCPNGTNAACSVNTSNVPDLCGCDPPG